MNKKRIFLNYDATILGLKDTESKEKYFLTQILTEKYDVVISEVPDYVIVSGYEYEYSYHHINEETILIQFQGEALAPNFTLCDYAIGFDDLSFGDRYLKWNFTFQHEKEYVEKPRLSEKLTRRKFCTFLAGNHDADIRQSFFQRLSQYQQVDSGGRVQNNMGRVIPPGREAKINFLSEYKFHLAFENTLYRGYTTEKIADAFCAHTIPVYWGNPDVTAYYNPASFINCHDYIDFEAVIEKIKELDQNPILYMSMLRAHPVNKQLIDQQHEALRDFLFHVFDQPLGQARRRPFGTTTRNVLGFFKKKPINPWTFFRLYLIKKIQSHQALRPVKKLWHFVHKKLKKLTNKV